MLDQTEVNVRGQRRGVARAWRAVAAVVLCSGALTACSSSSDEPQAGSTAPGGPSEARAAAAAPEGATDPLTLPDWWFPALPLPENASVVAVRPGACTLTFLDWGSDARVVAADLELEARSRGLETRLVSSVSEVDPPAEEDLDLGFADEVPVAPEVTHVVVLRMSRAAAVDVPAVDASLILRSRGGDAALVGEYSLGDDC